MKTRDTGIRGLDRLMGGGIGEGFVVLVEGEPGSGKSNMGLEYLYRGAENGQPGLYMSFQESEDEVLRTTTFDWDFDTMVDKGLINITKFDPYRHDEVAEVMRSMAIESGAERIVLDPVTDLDIYIDTKKDRRKNLLEIKREVRDIGATCLMTAEKEDSAKLEEQVADGIIEMKVDRSGDRLKRDLLVKKLKGTDFDHTVHSYGFDSRGIKVE